MDYKKLFDLSGRVCIVVGGTGYLGAQNAKILKDFGAKVINADLRELERRWSDTDELTVDDFVKCDISSTDSIKACFDTVAKKYGHIDVLINCAVYGGAAGKDSNLEFMSDDIWSRGIDGSLGCVFRATREVIPYMKERGGSIINYCSMYGLISPDLRIYGDSLQRQSPTYGSAKAGVAQFTRYAAGDLARYGIRVNAVTPGPFPNPTAKEDAEFVSKLCDKTMLGRVGEAYEMAGAILLLASNASSFMTGTNIVVDGGWTAW